MKKSKIFWRTKKPVIETLKEKINELEIQLENEKNKNINNFSNIKRGFIKNYRRKRGQFNNRFRSNRRSRRREKYYYSTNRNNKSNCNELNDRLDLNDNYNFMIDKND